MDELLDLNKNCCNEETLIRVPRSASKVTPQEGSKACIDVFYRDRHLLGLSTLFRDCDYERSLAQMKLTRKHKPSEWGDLKASK